MAHENAPGRTETLRKGHVRVGSREKKRRARATHYPKELSKGLSRMSKENRRVRLGIIQIFSAAYCSSCLLQAKERRLSAR